MYDDEDDIPVAQPPPKKEKMDIQMKFLQSQIAQKKNALQAAAARQKQAAKTSAPPPVIDLAARNKLTAAQNVINRIAPVGLRSIRANPVAENINFLPKAATDESFMMFGEIMVKNEYQAAVPNDYEKVAKVRQARKLKEKAAKNIAKRLAQEHKEEEAKRQRGAAIAPPQALIEPEPEKFEKPTMSSMPPPSTTTAPSFLPAFGKATSRGLGIAANIMAKHGYREGQGLGRMEQGMSTALQVERTGKQGGMIVAEAPKAPTFGTSQDALRDATKILILANVISVAEIKSEYENKDDFGAEIREEMGKCGQVVNVITHVNENAAEEGQRTRVFVEFTNTAQAIKAYVVMHGRFFGGRSIVAGFYDVDEYNSKNYDL